MTLGLFKNAFSDFGVIPFDSTGKPFDPEFQEAMSHEENSEVPENTVTGEFLKGYKIADQLLRPAQVIVSRALSGEDDSKAVGSTTDNENIETDNSIEEENNKLS